MSRLLSFPSQGLRLSGQRAPEVTPLTLAWDLPAAPGNLRLSLLEKRLLIPCHSAPQQPPAPQQPQHLALPDENAHDAHSARSVKAPPTAVGVLSEVLVTFLHIPQSHVWRGDCNMGHLGNPQTIRMLVLSLPPPDLQARRKPREPAEGAGMAKGARGGIASSQSKLTCVRESPGQASLGVQGGGRISCERRRPFRI